MNRVGRVVMLLAAFLCTLAAARVGSAGPDPSASRTRRAAQPIAVHALPNLMSKVLFVVKRGEPVTTADADVRVAALAPKSDKPACCGEGYYDRDQQTDIVDHLGEGYVAAVQEKAVAARANAAAAANACGAGSRASGCIEPVTLLEPGGLGRWVLVSSADGRLRGWALLTEQPAARDRH